MRKQIMDLTDRWSVSGKMLKALDSIIRNKDLDNITFRADLIDVQKTIEEILEKYKDEYKGKY